MRSSSWRTVLFGIILFVMPAASFGEKRVFQSPGHNYGVWQLTFDPTVRDWANYHNAQCFSPDGRYVCYSHWPAGSKSQATVHLFDLQTGTDREIGQGIEPRWARHHNWLSFVSYNTSESGGGSRGVETILLDVDTGERRVIAEGPGAESLGETTFDDRWLIGAQRFRGQTPEFRAVRIKLPEGGMEPLPDVTGSQFMTNPRHGLFFTRRDNMQEPFAPTRCWYDLDGTNRRIAVPTLQQCHMSWLGNGEYMLLGNGLVRGRRWDEPFPSNVHILASVGVGDISPCGTSGRWVCGDSTLADLRSGDGWNTIEPLSQICYPQAVADDSGIYDADPKGSPDGTKVCFVSNYPLADGPQTPIVAYDAKVERLTVASTDGFPDRGHVCAQREVIAYNSKTPTTFEEITRQAFDTAGANLREGRTATSFEARCLTEEQYRSLPRPNAALEKSVGDPDSPLMRQRMTDVYLVVVRKPDRPYLRLAGDRVELIPGENHGETKGYHLLCGGERITETPIAAGATLSLNRPGEYRAIAAEWSGLESEPSLPLRVDTRGRGPVLHVLKATPEDFSWTTQRAGVGDIRETVHVHDGVICREWLAGGAVVRRHDLNEQGKAVRQVEFRDGRIASREYHHRERGLVSRERFDEQGFITDWMSFQEVDGTPQQRDHWSFKAGMPVRHVVANGREYVKNGDRWGYFRDGRFVDTPRE